ncbi:hypothetical protein LR002_00155 [Candidatus Gracilibacteria bacterium]|nr:hypothetical protein [Candidatus Gracilibacteria bacterium]
MSELKGKEKERIDLIYNAYANNIPIGMIQEIFSIKTEAEIIDIVKKKNEEME